MARKSQLEFYQSENNRVIFVRLPDDENSDDSRVSLYRLLETYNVDVDQAMDKWRRIRAMVLPVFIIPQLKKYYTMVQLTEREWFSGE